jgi:hypothetical protein
MNRARRTAATLVVVVLVVLGLVAGCSSSAEPDSSADKSPKVAVSKAPPPPAAPKVGSCHRLSLSEATNPVDAGKPVPCSRPHTSVTVKVGRLSLVVDGHLLAIDSRTVRKQIAEACPGSPGAFVGGDKTAQQLSRFEVVWFSPSLEAADAGANWYRCDVVAPRSEGKLLTLPAKLKGVLDQEGALDRFGTCGTAAPDARGFKRVMCSQKHTWRAVDTISLPSNRRYLAKDVTAAADPWCKDVASKRAEGSLKFTWSFEWPPKAQWDAGQRWGYCWVPEG